MVAKLVGVACLDSLSLLEEKVREVVVESDLSVDFLFTRLESVNPDR